MSKIKGETPHNEEVWTDRGELRNPTDRSDQPGQLAPDRDETNAPADPGEAATPDARSGRA